MEPIKSSTSRWHPLKNSWFKHLRLKHGEKKKYSSVWLIRWRIISIFKRLICSDHLVNGNKKAPNRTTSCYFQVSATDRGIKEARLLLVGSRLTSPNTVCLCERWHRGLLPVSSGHHTRVRGWQKWHFCRIQKRKLSNHTYMHSNTHRPACMSNKSSSIVYNDRSDGPAKPFHTSSEPLLSQTSG